MLFSSTSVFASIAFFFKRNPNAQVACVIRLKFPESVSKANFFQSRTEWMRTEEHEGFVSHFRSQGKLLDKKSTVFEDRAEIIYTFKNLEDHNEFVNLLESRNTVNDYRLAVLGYKYTRDLIYI